jgi:hypothetical protein
MAKAEEPTAKAIGVKAYFILTNERYKVLREEIEPVLWELNLRMLNDAETGRGRLVLYHTGKTICKLGSPHVSFAFYCMTSMCSQVKLVLVGGLTRLASRVPVGLSQCRSDAPGSEELSIDHPGRTITCSWSKR